MNRNRSVRLGIAAAVLALIFPAVSSGQQVTLTPAQASGGGSVVPVLSWATTPAAAGCTASGAAGWSGAKAAAGSQTLPAITATATYRLDCTWPGDRRVTLSWTPPTTRTDGTALSGLAGTRVYYGLTAGTLAQLVNVPGAAVSTYIIEPLDPGTWHFALTAYDSAGVESARTSTVNKTTTADQQRSASATITVTAPPNPPTNVVIAQAAGVDVAAAYKVTATGSRGGAVVGFVPVGTPCLGAAVFDYRSQSYRRVPRAAVRWVYGLKPHDNAAAPCQAAAS